MFEESESHLYNVISSYPPQLNNKSTLKIYGTFKNYYLLFSFVDDITIQSWTCISLAISRDNKLHGEQDWGAGLVANDSKEK